MICRIFQDRVKSKAKILKAKNLSQNPKVVNLSLGFEFCLSNFDFMVTLARTVCWLEGASFRAPFLYRSLRCFFFPEFFI